MGSWNVQWDAWMHRNQVLHETPLSEVMSGSICLDRALKNEWKVGFHTLSRTIKLCPPNNVDKVLQATLLEKKGWLVLIRRAREAVGQECVKDEFSVVGSSLRKWVGL